MADKKPQENPVSPPVSPEKNPLATPEKKPLVAPKTEEGPLLSPIVDTNELILPETQAQFPEQDEITVQQELSWFLKENAESKRMGHDPALYFYGTDYWKNLTKISDIGSRLELKASQFLQDKEMDFHRTIPLYLQTRAANSGLTLESLIKNPDGSNYIAVNPSAITRVDPDRGPIDNIPFDPKAFPFLNKAGVHEPKPLGYWDDPQRPGTGVLFFSGQNDFKKRTKLFDDTYTIPRKQNVRQLATVYNNLFKDTPIPMDMIPETSQQFEIRMDVTKGLRSIYDNLTGKLPESMDPIGHSVMQGKWIQEEYDRLQKGLIFNSVDDFKKTPEEQEKLEAIEDYWDKIEEGEGEGMPNLSDPMNLKWWLIEKIQNHRWTATPEEGGFSDEEKHQLKVLGGAVANWHGDRISTDTQTGLAVDGFGSSPDNRMSATRWINRFLDSQAEMLDHRHPVNAEGASPWDVDLDKSVLVIQQLLQKMSDQRNPGWSDTLMPVGKKPHLHNPEGHGVFINKGEDSGEVVAQMASALKKLDGLGLAGGSDEEMTVLLQAIAIHAEILNDAALHGETHKPFSERAKPTYKDEAGNQFAYDHRFRRGLVETSVGGGLLEQPNVTNTQALLGGGMDPQYEFIMKFIKSLEDFVVVSGCRGQRITPMLQWLGHRSYRGSKCWKTTNGIINRC